MHVLRKCLGVPVVFSNWFLNMSSSWKKLPCEASVLNLEVTLSSGQCFRWKKMNEEWYGVLNDKVWILKENHAGIFYKVLAMDTEQAMGEGGLESETILNDYFQLDVDLHVLYQDWSKRDPHFKQVASRMTGYRLLRQDPLENLFSFICSSNNHIERISKMVEALCTKYGKKVAEIDGTAYHSFPTVTRLAEPAVEQELRDMKFGYRAKFIHETAKVLSNKSNDSWLMFMRSVPYAEAHAALCQLPGVGAKVADCVCLMSLDKTDAIPVDTHVWQISLRDYDIPGLKKSKSLTNTAYNLIGNYFRQLFGRRAGWANSVLFSADLRKFQNLKVVPFSQVEMKKQDGKMKRKPINLNSNGKGKRKK